MSASIPNIDDEEIRHFSRQARSWWDRKGPLKGLHDINPMRVKYISTRAKIKNQEILDIGCGGGILSESLARLGGHVTGIDASPEAISAARAHANENGIKVVYRQTTAEKLAEEKPGQFDLVTCMELLEHVPDPVSILTACRRLVKPGGEVFVSTINRNFASFVLAILVAEYLLGIVAKNTHTYKKFIRPEELFQMGKSAGLEEIHRSGFIYLPFLSRAFLSRDTRVNYMMHFKNFRE